MISQILGINKQFLINSVHEANKENQLALRKMLFPILVDVCNEKQRTTLQTEIKIIYEDCKNFFGRPSEEFAEDAKTGGIGNRKNI